MRQLIAGLVVVAAGLTAGAADDKPSKPAGTWVRDSDGIELKFQFQPKDVLKITVTAGDNGAVVTSKYTQGKDGVLKCEVTDSEEKGTFPAKPAVGSKMSFKFKIDGKTATLSDLEGVANDEAKKFVEGEYMKKDDK